MTAVSLLSDSQEVDFSLYLISISTTAGLLEAKNIANNIGKNISFGILYTWTHGSWPSFPLFIHFLTHCENSSNCCH